MIAEIIAVGSELLTPHRQDTNSLFLTTGLNDLGVEVGFKTIVGDNPRHLVEAIHNALRRADILIFSGGLGPTEDDLTRECVAEALDLNLLTDAATVLSIQALFKARRMEMPPNNLKQAQVLEGAELVPNPNGSAPGQWLETVIRTADGVTHRRLIILLPGPPKELKAIFAAEVQPRLEAQLPPRFLARRVLRMALIPESTVDARTAPIYSRFTDVETTILAGHGEIQLHFLCAKDTREEAENRVDQLAELVEREMGDDIFSSDGESLEEIVLLMLGLRGLNLAVAESCTGGLLAERLTAIPSASRTFLGGAIVYSNDLKVSFCKVPAKLIQQKGAISPEVARALAEGIRDRTKASLGLSITGIAGPTVPDGPDSDKPVGLVYIGLADEEDTQVKQFMIPGDRDRIRLWATQHALEMLRRSLQ
jgi:nicotinamide-nucleotide amidase